MCPDTSCPMQAFINTARKIYEKIETGVFDVSNEVRCAAITAPRQAPELDCPLIAPTYIC